MLNTSTFIKTISLALLIFVGLSSYAQDYNLEVESFSLEENSLTAKNEPVRDTNNQKCALVIISGCGNENLRFNVGNTFSKVEEKKNEQGEKVYLLWIPEGTIKVTITSDSKNFAPMDYFFNPRVKRAETYLMTLKITAMESLAGKQYLEFHINPASAYLEVNGEPWEVTNGVAYRQLQKGTYNYRIQSKNYHPEVGIVDLRDLSTKKIVEVNLKPNFGWLTIKKPVGIDNARLFIDEEIHTDGLEHIQLQSGQHTIKVSKEMYLPYSKTIELSDGQDLTITPELIPNFSQVEIVAKGGASIYIDDKFMGTDNWRGPLSAGNYIVEIIKDNHKTTSQTISIPKIGETYTFNYKELIPILGMVSVETKPAGVKVMIDGKDYGKSPIYIPDIIIGSHNIELTLKGYKTLNNSFNVEEGKQIDLSYNMQIGYGIMDRERILQSMPEYAILQENVASRTKRAENELAQMQERLNKLYEKYNSKQSKANADAVQSLNLEIEQFKTKSKQDIESYQKSEMEKLQKRILTAVNLVGKEEGFEAIFPKGLPLFCGSDVVDATNSIIRKLK